MIFAYIGPGPGLAIQAPILVVALALFMAFLSLLSLPVRYLWRVRLRRGKIKASRVIVVGLDGLEPSRVERLMAVGRLPHFTQLSKDGGYERLGTTCPPLSPVAWSSFSTGVNPGRHGIFGFVERDSQYRLRLTSARVETASGSHMGLWWLPWKRAKARFLRGSQSFWKTLADHGVLTHILRVPISWPPERFGGFLLSAMGAPDLLGTQGTYTFFSKQQRVLPHGRFQPLEPLGDVLCGKISGPGETVLPLRLGENWLEVDGHARVALTPGEYTPWMTLRFGSIHGIVKFLLVDPEGLYMTALQIDPARPASPISWPPLFSSTLARLLGPFATCGMAEDTGAYEDGVLSAQEFLRGAYDIHEERVRQFFHLLDRTPTGLLVGVFDGPDRIQHMFSAPDQENELDEMYERMDKLVGDVRARLDSETALLVLSDHGFKPLHTLVDVNAWLHQAGYLQVVEGEVDWPQSRAAVYNLSGIRFNVKGRESSGIVGPEEVDSLSLEIRGALLDLQRPEVGDRVFQDVFLAHSTYQGPYLERAPDIVLGFAPGFGLDKEAARGNVSSSIFRDNCSAWSGDHCYHPEAVPGILLSNLKLKGQPDIKDISATILDLLGVKLSPWMEGRSLLPSEGATL